jgi:hypothetical protein
MQITAIIFIELKAYYQNNSNFIFQIVVIKYIKFNSEYYRIRKAELNNLLNKTKKSIALK